MSVLTKAVVVAVGAMGVAGAAYMAGRRRLSPATEPDMVFEDWIQYDAYVHDLSDRIDRELGRSAGIRPIALPNPPYTH